MPPTVSLQVTSGSLHGQRFDFLERTTCLMGRADDCSPKLPNDDDHRTISRHHCLLDINPPDVRIRDFGSLNGTYVNGVKIGQRAPGQTPEEGSQQRFPEHDLREGDEIQLGDTIFRVHVSVPPACADCGAEISPQQKETLQRAPGVYQCVACRQKKLTSPVAARAAGKVCAHCGRDVAAEVGPNRQGEFVCADCKADPSRIVHDLVDHASVGHEQLLAIQDYTILKELGRGGMGAVFLAHQARTGEQVALKIMLPQVAASERSKEMFLREVENTKALKHPHIVRLVQSGCAQGTFFFTLEFCDGGSVMDLMRRRNGPLELKEAVTLTLQILDGLEYAHNVFGPGDGLVHRDLKPGNVFLCTSASGPVAKVGDYGLSKAFDLAGLSGQTRTGAMAGTPAFMPRQQVINFKYAKPEVDVWAAAASLYFMLTAQVPRDFPEQKDPWQCVLQNKAVPIRQRDSSVPARLADVIDQALIDNPAIPFKTAAQLKAALLQALSGN